MYFSEDETSRRLSLLQDQMKDHGVSAVMLVARGAGPLANENFYFLQNDFIPNAYSILLVFRDSAPVVLAANLQLDSHRRRSNVIDCRAVGEAEDPAAVVAKILLERGLDSSKIAWRPSVVPTSWYLTLAAELPNVEWVDFTARFREIWYCRSAEEALAVRKAAQLADGAYENLIQRIRPGMTEFDVVAELEQHTIRHGANRNFTLIASGPVSPDHIFPELAAPSRRKLDQNDCILLEVTPAVGGYWSQLVRMISVGEPSALATEMQGVCSDAIMAASAVLRNGCTIGAAGRAIMQSVSDAGYTATLPMGHTCGVDLIYDRLVPDSERVLHTDDTIIIHPKVSSPHHKSRFFWGETYRITDFGCECLNKATNEIKVARG